MEKIIKVLAADGQTPLEVKLTANANTLRLYRTKFKRDIIKDLSILQKSLAKVIDKPQEEQLEALDLEIFENCAYIMAKQADPSNVPGSIDKWMEQFAVFNIYEIMPAILELWSFNGETLSQSKKK